MTPAELHIVVHRLTLAEVIAELEKHHPAKVAPIGFGNPHSFRGYEQLAFEPMPNRSVGQMLTDARFALGATYEGWKGGEYTMETYTECWLAYPGSGEGETLGSLLLALLLSAGQP